MGGFASKQKIDFFLTSMLFTLLTNFAKLGLFFWGNWIVAKPSGLVVSQTLVWSSLFTKKANKKACLRNQTTKICFFQQKKVEYEKSATNNLKKLDVWACYEVQSCGRDQEVLTC